ncbi:MAG: non-ribosomal peptide synthetase [Steroidobacteraceae bacterium]
MPVASAFDDLLDRSNLTGRQFLIYAGQRLHPGLVLYNSVYAIRWTGLEPDRFRLAWQALVDSCDALRIVVEERDGVPLQRVLPPFPAEVACVDLDPDSGCEDALKNWIDRRLQRALVLSERVFDTALIPTAVSQYVWFLHVHHVVADGAAIQILLRRVTELYAGLLTASDTFPQFSEYFSAASAQRRSEEYRTAKSYWSTLLKDSPETPRFYGVDASCTTRQERVVLRLDASSSAALSALARSMATAAMSEHAVTANLFNAAFAAYLSRVGGTERVSIGVTFHNRNSEPDRRTIGLFMEVFPLCLRVGPQDTLRTLVRQVAACATQALKHRQYSVGHSSRTPAFSALFNYMRPLAKPMGSLDIRRVHPGHGSNAISLSIEPRGETYDLWIDINADVAAASSAQRVAEHLRTLLVAAVQAPDRALPSLSLLSPREAEDLLAACSGPVLTVPGTEGCHSQFEVQAAVSPAALALKSGDLQLSYADLNARANRLARSLRGLGAKRGKRVGICLERSPEMVIAVLAVLKSGAAYVPLDPAYPQARLHSMLGDADPVVLVTTERISASLPPHAARPLYVDQDAGCSGPAAHNAGIHVSAADIAYVIYTSGSTGTPKGVLVTHGGVSSHLAWRNSYFPVEPSDQCLQTASLSFDDSVWEMLEPLTAGACLVLTRPRFEYDSAYLVRLIVEQRITIACFVPSLLRAIVEEPDIGRCSSLRRLTTGGEGLSVSLQRRVLESLPAVAFFNGYGTTEATIASVYWRCVDIPGQSTVPIGRPIANTQVYVLDPHRQLVPPGVLGEIYIGGAGVAQGYLSRPELTAERFVESRLAGAPAAKLYRTGDLGRMRADGVIEFAGRLDNQVKIRGVRAELGDIEAALLDHPAVHAAAVVCDETPSGTRLTAYLVPRGAATIASADLRAFVRDRVPPALVPNRFEVIAALPLTPNGKLDRRALQKGVAAEEQSSFVAPRTEFEARVVRVWEEVLQARPIGIRDDFFALGGHSLSAVQVASSIERMLCRALSPGLLFEAPTIEMLASRISAFAAGRGALVPLAQGEPGAPLFLVHHVSGDVTAYRDLAHFLGAKRPIYGVRVPELDTNETPLDRVETMASRYVREIRALQPDGPYLIGGHSAGAHIAFEMAQQLRAAGERVALLAILEADARTRNQRRSLTDSVRHQIEAVRQLPAKQRGAYLWRKFVSWTDQPAATPPVSRAHRASPDGTKNAVWTAIERAVSEYRPRSYPGAVTLFRATDRRVTGTFSRTLGWGRLARGGIRVIDVPGSHSTVLRPGSEPAMAAKLRACLDEVTAEERAALRARVKGSG